MTVMMRFVRMATLQTKNKQMNEMQLWWQEANKAGWWKKRRRKSRSKRSSRRTETVAEDERDKKEKAKRITEIKDESREVRDSNRIKAGCATINKQRKIKLSNNAPNSQWWLIEIQTRLWDGRVTNEKEKMRNIHRNETREKQLCQQGRNAPQKKSSKYWPLREKEEEKKKGRNNALNKHCAKNTCGLLFVTRFAHQAGPLIFQLCMLSTGRAQDVLPCFLFFLLFGATLSICEENFIINCLSFNHVFPYYPSSFDRWSSIAKVNESRLFLAFFGCAFYLTFS